MSIDTPRRSAAVRRFRFLAWMVLLLLVAAWFRFHLLAGIPPGLTHDEADHGLTAIDILGGTRSIYFTVGYGREPLYDYATAGMIALLGPSAFAGRLTAAFFSLLLVSGAAAWARRAFGAPVALLAAAGLAIGFWPVMAGRQMLRSITLPAIFTLAVLAFWVGLSHTLGSKGAGVHGSSFSPRLPGSPARSSASVPLLQRRALRADTFLVVAGLLLGLTAYTYIPARAMWLLLPALAAFLAFGGRKERARPGSALWRALGLTLLVAALVALPLAVYLHQNPGLEVRIGELSAPLRAAASGDLRPVLDHALGSLRLFTIEGDQTWRYNVAGRPWLRPLSGLLFYAGLLYAGWLALRSARLGRAGLGPGAGAFTALVWLALGLAPVLVTGPGLSMTQAIGLLPVLYVFPALAAVAIYAAVVRLLAGRGLNPAHVRPALATVGVLLLVGGAAVTYAEYFGEWANAPEVRVQYETAMVTALEYLNAHAPGPAAISTITPGRYHSPAIAALVSSRGTDDLRWFDGRQSLLFPDEPSATLVLPGFTPPPEALGAFWALAEPLGELPMRPDDLDRPLRLYRVQRAQTDPFLAAHLSSGPDFPLRFGDSLELIGYALPTTTARPGDKLRVITAWRLLAPLENAALFSHILSPDGGPPLAQADGLGAPGESWQAGDVLIQLHEIPIPAGILAGSYPLVAGVYTSDDGQRLEANGRDAVTLAEVTIE